MVRHTFGKCERLCSRKAIEELFGGGARSCVAFPVRAVYKDGGEATQVLMSVSKRRFRHAVDRNRAKRQLREAYRLNKGLLTASSPLNIAFVWLSDAPVESERVHRSMRTLLHRISETCTNTADSTDETPAHAAD